MYTFLSTCCCSFTLQNGMPDADDATSEMVQAAAAWSRHTSRRVNEESESPHFWEFVHIHKAGGYSLDAMAPPLVCGANASCVTTIEDRFRHFRSNRSICCLVRPDPSLRSALKSLGINPLVTEATQASQAAKLNSAVSGERVKFLAAQLRYFSSKEEAGAFTQPWHTNVTYKAVMLRAPNARWKSAQAYRCRTRNHRYFGNDTTRAYRDALYHMRDAVKVGHHLRAEATDNMLALWTLPPALTMSIRSAPESEEGRMPAFTDTELARAERVLGAYAFLGITERYDESMCLFAYATTSPSGICQYCCRNRKLFGTTTVRANAQPAGDTACSFNYTEDDERLFAAYHKPDESVYAIATRIFEARCRLVESKVFRSPSPSENLCSQCTIIAHRSPTGEWAVSPIQLPRVM